MEVRKKFPYLEGGIVYLDSAATAQKPKEVIETMNQFYFHEYAPIHRSIYDLSQFATERYDEARKSVAKFISAKSEEEIVFTKGTTESINLVASSFGFQKGDEIIVAETEHHSNIVPWQRCRATIKVVPIDKEGFLKLEVYEKMLSSRTKLVAIAHATNTTGAIYPIEDMAKMAHAKGAVVLVDGAQTVAHMKVDVTKMNVDFFAFSGHKMYGPTGIGVLFGKRELLKKMVPYQTGGGMIEEVFFDHTTFVEPPLRFEAGTTPFAEAVGLRAAINFLEKEGLENICKFEDELTSYALNKLSRVEKVKILAPKVKRGPLVSFIVEGIHPVDIGTFLGLKNVCVRTGHLCAQPTMRAFGILGVVRASFGIYNTYEEVDLFINSLEDAIKKLFKKSSK